MSTITYHQPDGSTQTVEVPDGTSVMRAALEHDIPGIVGECGGQLMCATCHVYVRDPANQPLREIREDEEEMLEATAAERILGRSRLGCQLRAGSDFTGIEVDVPEQQY